MRIILSVFCLVAGIAASARADDFLRPRLLPVDPDWAQVSAAADAIDALTPRAEAPKGSKLDALNGALDEYFPKIASSAVPVLLPFDAQTYLHDRVRGEAKPRDAYLSGFQSTQFFLPGPSGYDAVFALRPGSISELSDIRYLDPIYVEISGFAFTYDLLAPKAAIESVPRDLVGDFPDIRRVILESHVRYTFTRYGVPYAVSIQCYDAAPRPRRLSCKYADRVAARALRALRLAGGRPLGEGKSPAPRKIARPDSISPDFTYYGPGKLIPNTGTKNNDGDVDYTVYAKIRYPMAQAPSFANSQSFMNWGDCDQTGRVPNPGGRKGRVYRCRVNDKPLVFDESAPENYSYPWRDNFCEHRYFFVGQCGAGLGHQGQDIRPGSCHLHNDGADRCEPYHHDVVAVRDGMLLRAPKQEGLFLVANGENERVRFRYMHMNPNRMDEDGMLSGRRVTEGETIGKVGNYNRKENGTTYHLHFEAMVPTRDGWVRVNPYMTLVSAYERLIGGRGREIKDTEPDPALAVTAAPNGPGAAKAQPAIEHSLEATKRHKRRHRRRH
jgi:hypothetical protein